MKARDDGNNLQYHQRKAHNGIRAQVWKRVQDASTVLTQPSREPPSIRRPQGNEFSYVEGTLCRD